MALSSWLWDHRHVVGTLAVYLFLVDVLVGVSIIVGWRRLARERAAVAIRLRIAQGIVVQLRAVLLDAERLLASERLDQRLHDRQARADDPERD